MFTSSKKGTKRNMKLTEREKRDKLRKRESAGVNFIKVELNIMLCPIIFNSNTIELPMHTSCYCGLRLTLCYHAPAGTHVKIVWLKAQE